MNPGHRCWSLFLAGLVTALCGAAPPEFVLPDNPAVPEGLGVNIHFTDPRPGEMEMLAVGGFRWVRMDFAWGGTEREKGRYDFRAYDRLLAALRPHGIRVLFILDYSNRHYDNDQSPCSDEGRAAFARWAAAAVERFQGRGILWEMYNEPNISFWRPKPDVQQYAKLALAVGQAIRRVAPDEMYIGPATSGVDLPFLEKCFEAGLLEYWSAVSVHPYRQQAPETAADDYARLRRLIAKYAPGKRIPILSGEWGYSSVWQRMDADKQGKLLPRQWLTNLAHDVPVSIWYDWHDDGPDPKEPEHHFGTVLHPHRGDQRPVYEPKPAYLAAKTLTAELAGFHFNKRLHLGRDDDYALLWTKGPAVRLAVWTTAKDAHKVTIPASPGRFAVTGHTGQLLPAVTADQRGLTVTLHDAPQYLAPEQPNDLLQVAAAWQRAPWEISVAAPQPTALKLGLRNPLATAIRVGPARDRLTALPPGQEATLASSIAVLRDADLQSVPLTCVVDGHGELLQTARVTVSNPLRVQVLAETQQGLAVRIENPSGEAFRGLLRATDATGVSPAQTSVPVKLDAGCRELLTWLPLASRAPRAWRLGIRVEGPDGTVHLERLPTAMSTVDDFSRLSAESLGGAYQLVPDGDAKVRSTQTLTLAAPAAGPPVPGVATLRIDYQFDKGWKFVRLTPREEAVKAIARRPEKFGLWVFGDGSGNHLRLRFVDATGQTFQPDGGRLDWRGWRYVTFLFDASRCGHWGGAQDGIIHDPIHWDSLLLIDSARREATAGEVYVACPVLIGG
jgi:hypothetical protein